MESPTLSLIVSCSLTTGSWCTSQHFWPAINDTGGSLLYQNHCHLFRCLYAPSCLLADYVAHFTSLLYSWSLNRELMETRAMQWILKCHNLGSVTPFAPSPHLLIYWSKCVIKGNNGGVHAEPSFYLQFFFYLLACQEGVLCTEHEQILIQHASVF